MISFFLHRDGAEREIVKRDVLVLNEDIAVESAPKLLRPSTALTEQRRQIELIKVTDYIYK